MKTLPQKGTFLKCVTYMTTPSVLTPSVVHLFICSFFRSTQSEKKNALSLLSNIRGYVNFFYYFPKPQVDFHLLTYSFSFKCRQLRQTRKSGILDYFLFICYYSWTRVFSWKSRGCWNGGWCSEKEKKGVSLVILTNPF